MKRIVVTGGLGFIGSHLVDRLLRNGDEVTIIDDGRTAVSPPDPKNGCHLSIPVEEMAGGRTSVDARVVSEGVAVDEVYHLASPVGPVGLLLREPGSIAYEIVRDAAIVAAFARDHRARLCHVSSSEIYGGVRGAGVGLRETDAALVAVSGSARMQYALGKLAAETTVLGVDVDSVVVRPFNVVGPRQRPDGGFVLARFLRQAMRGEPLTVYGDGQQVRAFTHVEDVVEGLVLAARSGKDRIYNVGNPGNVATVLGLAKRVLAVTGSKSKIEHVDPKALHGPRFEEATDKYPNADRLMALGWVAKYDLDGCVRSAWDALRGAGPK